MELFYAVAKDTRRPCADAEENGRRYLIAFASREVADEWWRAVSDPIPGSSPTLNTISRISPQFYTYDSSQYEISGTVLDAGGTPDFRDKVIFTLLPNRDSARLCFIPPQSITEHKNSGSYFIRSKAKPHVYWFETSSGKIAASDSKRSRFIIRIDPETTHNTVLIGTDDVLIAPIRDPNKFVQSNNGDGGLRLTRNGIPWKFNNLKNRFVSYNPSLRRAGTSSVHDEPQIHAVTEGRGEEWELVE